MTQEPEAQAETQVCYCLARGDAAQCVCRPSPLGNLDELARDPETDDCVFLNKFAVRRCGCKMGGSGGTIWNWNWNPTVSLRAEDMCRGCTTFSQAARSAGHHLDDHEPPAEFQHLRRIVHTLCRNKYGYNIDARAGWILATVLRRSTFDQTVYFDFVAAIQRLGANGWHVAGCTSAAYTPIGMRDRGNSVIPTPHAKRNLWKLWSVDPRALQDTLHPKYTKMEIYTETIRLWEEVSAFCEAAHTNGKTPARKFQRADGDHACTSRILRFLMKP